MHRATAWTILGALLLLQPLPTPAQHLQVPDASPPFDQYEVWSRRAPEVFQVRFETSQGPFVVEARREWAPQGVDRFFGLSNRATSLPQEMIAGATTFASMAYIIAVTLDSLLGRGIHLMRHILHSDEEAG